MAVDKLTIDLTDIIKGVNEAMQLRKLRKEHRYTLDLIRILMPHKNGLSRRLCLHDLERQRREDGLPMPKTFEMAAQSAYNNNCVDSDRFKKRKLPDVEAPFYTPGGKGSGTWAVNPDRARRWLEKHDLLPDT